MRSLSMSIDAPTPRGPWVTWTALAIALVLMIVRLTTPEALREPWAATPGGPATPRGPGPAVGMLLDLLALLPALLVLSRRAFDSSFRLTWKFSHALLWAAVVWTGLSVLWSADKFAAVVGASHLFAAAATLWAVSQCAGDGASRRLVAGVCFGLLLLLSVQLLLFRFIDVPADARYWDQNKTEILKEHNWDANSFLARQLEMKLKNGETVSFFTSPNTLAAVGVTLMAVVAMAGVQRVRDGDGPGWWGLTAAAIVSTIWILLEARSKTSIGTPVLGVLLLGAFVLNREKIRRHATRAYVAGVIAVVMAVIAVIGHGLYHHGLFKGHFSDSLDFRWKYWTASAKLVAQKPLFGVGFANFGSHYLSVRQPDAVEEIQDPHNVLVRFAVETGLVGLTFVIAWLARVAWEITRPIGSSPVEDTRRVPLVAVASVAVLGIIISTLVNVDFSQGVADVSLEVMRRLLYALVLVAGTLLVTMRSPHETRADDRPAGWIFYGIVIALVLFFVHNLIDFSFFEPGPMLASLLLCGVAVARGVEADDSEISRRKGLAIGGLAVALVGWVVFALALVVPISAGDLASAAADEATRQNKPAEAVADLQIAMASVPYNAEYAERAAGAELQAGRGELARPLLDRAVALDPMRVSAYLLRAQVEMAGPSPSADRVAADFDRILAINPNDVTLRLQYAAALDRLDRRAEALKQYRAALAANNALGPDEPRRLSATQLDAVNAAVARDER